MFFVAKLEIPDAAELGSLSATVYCDVSAFKIS